MESLPNPEKSHAPPPPDPALLHSHSWWHALVKNRDRRGSAGFSENMGDGINLPDRIHEDEGFEGHTINLGRSLEKVGISISTNMSANDPKKHIQGLHGDSQKDDQGLYGSFRRKSGNFLLEVEKCKPKLQSGDIYDLVDKTYAGHFSPSPNKEKEVKGDTNHKLLKEKYRFCQPDLQGQHSDSDSTHHPPLTKTDVPVIRHDPVMKDKDTNWNTIRNDLLRHPENLVTKSDSNSHITSQPKNSDTNSKKAMVQDPHSDYTILPAITKELCDTHLDYSILPATTKDYTILPAITKNSLENDSDYSILPTITKKFDNPDSDYTVLPAITKNSREDDSDYTILPAITKKPDNTDNSNPIILVMTKQSIVKDTKSDHKTIPTVPKKQTDTEADIEYKSLPSITLTASSDDTSGKKSNFVTRKISNFLQSSWANSWFFKGDTSEDESDIESTKSDNFNRSDSEVSGCNSPTISHTGQEGIQLRRNSKWNAVRDALYNHPEKFREMNTWQPQN